MKTQSEDYQQQARKVEELRKRLAADFEIINGQLCRGGDFRSGEDLKDSGWLCRWLRARCWSVDRAEECIREHAKWRVEYCPSGRVHECEVPNELGANKLFLQGMDTKGRGVFIFHARNHSAWTRDLGEVVRVAVYCIDALLDMADPSINPDRVLTAIFDLTDFGVSNVDLTAMIKLFHTINNHFVERLGKCFINNAGTVFEGSWNMFSGMLDEVTLQKISFIGPENLGALHKEVPLEILPRELGGNGELVPATKAVADLRRRKLAVSNGVS